MSDINELVARLVNERITAELEKRDTALVEEIARIYKLHNTDKECECDYCAGMRMVAGEIDAQIHSENVRDNTLGSRN